MKLTLVNQYYPPDLAPTGHLAASLAEHRAGLGDEVTVITGAGRYAGRETSRERAAFSTIRIVRLRTLRFGRASLVRQALDHLVFYLGALWHLARLPAQDVLLALTTPPWIGWVGWVHKGLHPGAKLVIWTMDAYPEAIERFGAIRPESLVSRVARGVSKGLLTRADAVVALDDAMKSLLTSHYALDQAGPPVTVIPNWEPAANYPIDGEVERWTPPLGIEVDELFTVLYMGNAGRAHDFATVLKAAHQLRDEKVAFLFVGGGPQWNSLKQAKDELDLRNLHLVDYVPEDSIAPVMAGADCGLIVMRDDALGVISPSKLHGYLATGLPVIYVGPKGGNVDEAIQRYGCGISLRIGDVAGLADFIHLIRSDPERRESLGDRARVAFETSYSDAVALPQFDRLLGQLTGPQ